MVVHWLALVIHLLLPRLLIDAQTARFAFAQASELLPIRELGVRCLEPLGVAHFVLWARMLSASKDIVFFRTDRPLRPGVSHLFLARATSTWVPVRSWCASMVVRRVLLLLVLGRVLLPRGGNRHSTATSTDRLAL